MCLTKIIHKDINESGVGYKVYYCKLSDEMDIDPSSLRSIHRDMGRDYEVGKTYTDEYDFLLETNVRYDSPDEVEKYRTGFHIFKKAGDAIEKLIMMSKYHQCRMCLVEVYYEEGHTIGEDEFNKSLTIVARKITLRKIINEINDLTWRSLI